MDEVLPPLYGRWMAELLGGSIDPEVKATCHDCAMVARPGVDARPQEVHYLPDVKCCGYYPDLANFAVGGILGDGACSGGQVMLERIARGVRATPLGVDRPAAYAAVQRAAPRRTFGQARPLRCGYLTADGRCGIWRHRDSTCASFFCRFNRGAAGRQFWEQLRLLLHVIEQQLAMWCVVELDVGDDALAHLVVPRASDGPLTLPELRGHETAEEHAELWGNWAGRELAFYRAASELVAPLTWARVVAMAGPLVAAQARIVKREYDRLGETALPASVRVEAHRAADLGDGRSRMVGYSLCDPLEVPAAVRHQLHRFEGVPTERAMAELGVDAATVRRLLDHRILIPAAALVRHRDRPPPDHEPG